LSDIFVARRNIWIAQNKAFTPVKIANPKNHGSGKKSKKIMKALIPQ